MCPPEKWGGWVAATRVLSKTKKGRYDPALPPVGKNVDCQKNGEHRSIQATRKLEGGLPWGLCRIGTATRSPNCLPKFLALEMRGELCLPEFGYGKIPGSMRY